MKTLLITSAFCLFYFCCRCQYNLVPNYSFEDSVKCPKFGDNSLPKPWYIPSNFANGAFLHSCSLDTFAGVPYNYYCTGQSFQYAKSGNGYAAINPFGNDGRIYLQVKLKDSLRRNHCYYSEFWTSLGNLGSVACNNISLLFSNISMYSDTILNPFGNSVIPANSQIINYGNPIISDTLNWVKVSGVYMAQGGERYITIGNFRYDNQTDLKVVNANGCNYTGYYVDDVSVIPLDTMPLKADAGTDTTIAIGDSTFIGSYTNGLTNVKWYNSTGQVIDNVRPGFYVKPTSSTFYVIEQTVCGYTSRDTVSINVNPLPLHWLGFICTAINNKAVSINWQTANEENVSHFTIQRSRNGRDFIDIAEKQAANTPYNEYSYFDEPPGNGRWYYRLISLDKDGRKTYSVIRSGTFIDDAPALSIYPNPTRTVVHIAGDKIKKVEIVDLLGRRILIQKFAGSGSVQLNVSKLNKGMYLIRITSANNFLETKKLLID